MQGPVDNEPAWHIFPASARDRVHVEFEVVATTSLSSAKEAEAHGILANGHAVEHGKKWSETLRGHDEVQFVVFDDLFFNEYNVVFSCGMKMPKVLFY